MNNNHDTRHAVLAALQKTGTPMDSYQVAKATGVSPIQAARTLTKLTAKGLVLAQDPLGAETDLSARFSLAPEQETGGDPG
ncbi:MarR family transcriptional regulator [Cupriavidus basilensis]|uniref:MarR family transcriptional regulator n=1 Tax=Cupriavidus basilensis TaxID=68895 RepID=A0ABT6AZ63_9BURK|nr:MarR family transcriptional regulator [Cupriavidus basilensis]MDF3837908.1 MarR family transcriptional regulator [Cupriavidus basilensis]